VIERSAWYDQTDLTACPVVERPPAEAPVVVIGGGITGASALYHLAARGTPALLLEAGPHLSHGATGRNAGFLLGGTVEYFDEAAAKWGAPAAAAIWAFTLENNRGIKNAIAREGIACDLAEVGQLVLASSEAEWGSVQRTVQLMKESGLETQLLDARGVEERTGLTGFYGGRYQPDDATLNPAALVVGLAAAAVRQGAQTAVDAPVGSLEWDRGVWRLSTPQGDVRTRDLVLAANAWVPQLWPGASGAITPVRGQVLATAPVPPGLVTQALSTNYGYEYWRQMPNGQVLLGGMRWTEPDQALDTLDTTCQQATHDRLAAFVCAHYPSLADIPITHRWGGLMAFSRDRLPFIGRVPGWERAYVAAGYTGHGMAFGYLAARCLADLILEGETDLDIARYSPARFQA